LQPLDAFRYPGRGAALRRTINDLGLTIGQCVKSVGDNYRERDRASGLVTPYFKRGSPVGAVAGRESDGAQPI
jgi:hypothetical protein